MPANRSADVGAEGGAVAANPSCVLRAGLIVLQRVTSRHVHVVVPHLDADRTVIACQLPAPAVRRSDGAALKAPVRGLGARGPIVITFLLPGIVYGLQVGSSRYVQIIHLYAEKCRQVTLAHCSTSFRARRRFETHLLAQGPAPAMVLRLDGAANFHRAGGGDLDADSVHPGTQVLVQIEGRHLHRIVAVDHSVCRISVGHWQCQHCQ